LKDTRTPTIVTTLAMALNLVLSLLLSALFSAIGWLPHGGLALANSLATFLEVSVLLVLLRRKACGLGGRAVLSALGQSALAGAGMALALWAWLALTAERSAWLVAPGGVVVGVLVYGLLLLALRVPEVHWLFGVASRRIRRLRDKTANTL
jgi:putative peptidoglycan lipid II flippase